MRLATYEERTYYTRTNSISSFSSHKRQGTKTLETLLRSFKKSSISENHRRLKRREGERERRGNREEKEGGRKKRRSEDEESWRTRSRKGGCGWHHWELFIPLYYTSALLFYEHFLPLRPRERRIHNALRIPSFVCVAENLRPVDRYLETRWRAPRQLSHRLARNFLPAELLPPNLYIFKFAVREMRPREEGGRGGRWLLIFCKRRRPLCEILLEAKRANTVFQY